MLLSTFNAGINSGGKLGLMDFTLVLVQWPEIFVGIQGTKRKEKSSGKYFDKNGRSFHPSFGACIWLIVCFLIKFVIPILRAYERDSPSSNATRQRGK